MEQTKTTELLVLMLLDTGHNYQEVSNLTGWLPSTIMEIQANRDNYELEETNVEKELKQCQNKTTKPSE